MFDKLKNIAVKTGNGITKVWDFLDGKKTVIGTGLLIVSNYLPRHTAAYQICRIAGELFGEVGIGDKLRKTNLLPKGLRK